MKSLKYVKGKVMNHEKYLKEIEQVIAEGPYNDTWDSLSDFKVPQWYKNDKFGIFIHWGIYSVPGFQGEWYLRNMYTKDHPVFQFHKETYGEQKEFGYKELIPLFRAEAFNPKEWVELFKKSGAKFIMPVAEHHDGFQMYDSELSQWCAFKMGPKKDVLGLLKKEAEEQGLTFCASSHRAEHYWFANGSLAYDSGVPVCPDRDDIYWPNRGEGYNFEQFHDVTALNPEQDFLEDWLVRTCELVDKYQPKLVYFDWWIQNLAFKPYLRKFAAYYYNRAAQWGKEVAINYKYDAFRPDTAVMDIERGQLDNISPDFWQCDTSVLKNSWCYTVDSKYKKPEDIICDLVDIVSKNGALLLNVGPKADGTIPDEDRQILETIGEWLSKNGEGIYGTRYFKVFGEGPTKIKSGFFCDTDRNAFTSQDFRFTMKGRYLYAFVMKRPENGTVSIKALGRKDPIFNTLVRDVTVLENGTDAKFEQKEEELTVHFNCEKDSTPVCLKISYE